MGMIFRLTEGCGNEIRSQPTVEIEPQRTGVCFTRRVPIVAPFDPPQATEF
jgi:hypothetical protein